jgi:hypothetical protein
MDFKSNTLKFIKIIMTILISKNVQNEDVI